MTKGVMVTVTVVAACYKGLKDGAKGVDEKTEGVGGAERKWLG